MAGRARPRKVEFLRFLECKREEKGSNYLGRQGRHSKSEWEWTVPKVGSFACLVNLEIKVRWLTEWVLVSTLYNITHWQSTDPSGEFEVLSNLHYQMLSLWFLTSKTFRSTHYSWQQHGKSNTLYTCIFNAVLPYCTFHLHNSDHERTLDCTVEYISIIQIISCFSLSTVNINPYAQPNAHPYAHASASSLYIPSVFLSHQKHEHEIKRIS